MIRPAVADDIEAVLALAVRFGTSFKVDADCLRDTAGVLLEEPTCCFLVAEQDGVVVGYLLGVSHLTFFANGPVGWVEEIMVDDSVRLAGLGRELMTAFEAWAKELGCAMVSLATRRADVFYRALGYEESATYFRKLL